MKRLLIILVLLSGCNNFTLTVDELMMIYENGWRAGVNREQNFEANEDYWKLDSLRTRKNFEK